eukprot:5769505-Prymnesium_polylepis.2
MCPLDSGSGRERRYEEDGGYRDEVADCLLQHERSPNEGRVDKLHDERCVLRRVRDHHKAPEHDDHRGQRQRRGIGDPPYCECAEARGDAAEQANRRATESFSDDAGDNACDATKGDGGEADRGS